MPEIRHFLKIASTPEATYRALTTREGLSSWWTRDTWFDEDFACFGFNQRSTVFKMRIDEQIPNRRVQWTCLGENVPEWQNTVLFFEIEPATEGVGLHFGHLKWKRADGILPMCSFDWARYLMSLREYLETGQGKPHQG